MQTANEWCLSLLEKELKKKNRAKSILKSKQWKIILK